jgi:hypothetical protein
MSERDVTILVRGRNETQQAFQSVTREAERMGSQIVARFASVSAAVIMIERSLRQFNRAMREAAEQGTDFGDAVFDGAERALFSVPIIGQLAEAVTLFATRSELAQQRFRSAMQSAQTEAQRMNVIRQELTREMQGEANMLSVIRAAFADMQGLSFIGDRILGTTNETNQARIEGFRTVIEQRRIQAEQAAEEERIQQERQQAQQEAERAEEQRLSTIERINNALRDQVRLLDADMGDRELMQLGDLGASEAQIQQAEELVEILRQQRDERQALLEQQREEERIAREAQRVWEETRTPLERYNQELERLGDLLRAGAIDQETFARAALRAQRDLETQQESRDQRSAARSRRLSFDDARLLTRAPGRDTDPQVRIAQAQERQLQQGDKLVDTTAALARDVKRILQDATVLKTANLSGVN